MNFCYLGSNSKDAKEFIQNKFKEIDQKLLVYYTCAVDLENAKLIVNRVKENVVSQMYVLLYFSL